MEFESITKARKQYKHHYIGKINNGSKHKKAKKYNELVYTIYLSPANSSGFEVCPGRSAECTKFCLNESGFNRMNMKDNSIIHSRIKKTRLFFNERDFFVRWVIEEIKHGIEKAKKNNLKFSVRLNNTSDISPEEFFIFENGQKKNILEIFPDVQFYDYTKVPNRIKLMEKYENYDVTFSYNGKNMVQCLKMLENNVRVAVVFDKIPDKLMDYDVINGDLYDMRYKDPKNVIVGLKFKKVREKLSENIFVIETKK